MQNAPEINNSIKMEVGIEDCLHIEFEYAKSKYHLKARLTISSRGVVESSPPACLTQREW